MSILAALTALTETALTLNKVRNLPRQCRHVSVGIDTNRKVAGPIWQDQLNKIPITDGEISNAAAIYFSATSEKIQHTWID